MRAILSVCLLLVAAVAAQDVAFANGAPRFAQVGAQVKGNCFPDCKWNCDTPTCPAVCEPQCEKPACELRCEKLGETACDIRCEKPRCEVRCSRKNCQASGCPLCEKSACPLSARPSAPPPFPTADPLARHPNAPGRAESPPPAPSPSATSFAMPAPPLLVVPLLSAAAAINSTTWPPPSKSPHPPIWRSMALCLMKIPSPLW